MNLDKPAGWTSHDCIARLRRILGEPRIGHGGTLDPAATGVLPVAVGRATRLLRFLADRKGYRATIRLGLTTDTDDLEGRILTEASAGAIAFDEVRSQLARFEGTIQQVPPRYSAIRQQGVHLYDLARRGAAIEAIAPRTVEIDELKILGWQPGERAELTVEVLCSAGTYIRSIARDLGAALGCGAALAHLIRIRSGRFWIEQSLPLDQVEPQFSAGRLPMIEAAAALDHLEIVRLPPEEAARWQLGQKIAAPGPEAAVQVQAATGQFLGVACRQEGLLRPEVVFGPPR